MNRLLILFFSILLCSCCKDQKLLNNGLTKKVSKITDYTIKVETDTLNRKVQDTLVVTIRKYNENDQIISRNQWNLIKDETVDIEFVYNEQNKIQKEIVKTSNDSTDFTVNYFYKDTLLVATKSDTKNDSFQIKQIGSYKYSSYNVLQESSLKQIFFDLETNDTIRNTLEVSEYNDLKYVTQITLTDFLNPERNRVTKYDYDCSILIRIKEYDSKNSLLLTTEYNYEFDKFKNWIKRESFENNKLKYIQKREIEYK